MKYINMSWEKFGKTIYFFRDFNDEIDDEIIKRMNNIFYIEFVDYTDFYDPNIIKKTQYPLESIRANIFNNSVDNLPSHVKSIIFGNEFNKPIPCLPYKLKELVFGVKFNQDVSNLPPNLTKLIFGTNFNQDVSNLPPIKFICFGAKFDNTLDYLPCSITHLELNVQVLNKSENLPLNIKYLIIDEQPNIYYYYANNYALANNEILLQNIPSKTKIIYKNYAKHKNGYLRDKKIKL
jgi:hypothetical protein